MNVFSAHLEQRTSHLQFILTRYSRPVFTYLKSRGFYAGVQVDGTVIIERTDENERFYGQRIGVADILAGKARHPPYEIKMLMETLKAAEGRNDVDSRVIEHLNDEPAPADFEVTSPTGSTFGIPEPDDPDPFGVLALEKIGLEIKEAGTKSRPPSSQFDYNPSPTSPIFSRFHRKSMDTIGTKSNRESYMSTLSNRTRRSMDRSTQTTEMGTQTDYPISPVASPNYNGDKRFEEIDEEPRVVEPEEVDYTKIDLGPYSNLNHSQDFDGTTVNGSPRERDTEHHTDATLESQDVSEDEEEEEEEPVIFEAASAQARMLTPQAIKARGGLVNIPKRPPPPPLPPRNVARSSRSPMIDQGSGRSPMRSDFEEVDLHGVSSANRKSLDVAAANNSAKNSVKEVPTNGIDTASTKSGESEKGIVMKDLEEPETLKPTEALNEKFEHAPEEQHLQNPTPPTEEASKLEPIEAKPPMAEEALKHESNEMKDTVGTIEDEFHSVPSTPNEIEVK